MTTRLWVILGLALLLGAVLANCFFVVDQRQQAVVVNLGSPVRTINAAVKNPAISDDPGPGLKLKAPWEQVVILDRRNQMLEPDKAEEAITVDQVRLAVDVFLRYRITDPLQFYQTLHSEEFAKGRLEPLLNASLRQVVGAATSTEVISQKRAALMAQTLAVVRQRAAQDHFGIEVIDVRIKRADLPTQNQQAVFGRMTTNLQQQAAQILAQGEQQKREIMAGADKEVTVTVATATQEASTTRGEGDAQRATIFAKSFGRDPSFAAFWRSMQAYKAALGDGTTMVLSPDSDFFKYFKQGPGKK